MYLHDTAFHRAYHYDSLERVDQIDNPLVRTGAIQTQYSYDQLGRLLADSLRSACGTMASDSVSGIGLSCTSLQSSDGFSYDAMGNRTDHSASTGTGNRLSALNGETISYDTDGNITQKYKSGSYNHQYFWSAESRLDSAVLDSWSMVKYGYNALGKPVIKYRRDPNSSWYVDSYFVWDGDQLLADLDSAGHRRADYLYNPGADQPFAETLGATTPTGVRYQQQDALGT